MNRCYLIRYGVMGAVGRFAADDGVGFARGELVVVRSHRGTELGEVLLEAVHEDTEEQSAGSTPAARVLRAALPEDLARARTVEAEREARFAACLRVFQDGLWPIDVVDVESLLDDRRTVVHYLGSHRLDFDGLLASFRALSDLDVRFEPVGEDVPEDEPDPGDMAEDGHGCGSCGESGGCGAGGCGASGGCSDCGVMKALASRA